MAALVAARVAARITAAGFAAGRFAARGLTASRFAAGGLAAARLAPTTTKQACVGFLATGQKQTNHGNQREQNLRVHRVNLLHAAVK